MLSRRIASRPGVALGLLVVVSACSDAGVTSLDTPSADGRPQKVAVEAASPTEGATLSGLVTFRALVGGSPASVTWSVDGGSENPMSATGVDWTAAVDTAPWTWRGTGPYRVVFRAWDAKKRTLGERAVNVHVVPPQDGEGGEGEGPVEPESPLAGALVWADPLSNARKQADAWRLTRPADAQWMDRMAAHGQADWYGDWTPDVRAAVSDRLAQVAAAGGLPVFVAYNLPLRDCGSYSAGGAAGDDAYRSWIRAFADGLAGRRAVVVLEPDGLAQLGCLDAAGREARLALLRDAVQLLTAAGGLVYLDAGHPRWHAAPVMAERLLAAGVTGARGFALNVSNFVGDDENLAYGRAISDLVGGLPFVVDSSRNGLGPTADGTWCNPEGRALGRAPTFATALAGVDAFLWIKRPGESDGSCGGGPSAGQWWAEYALGLASRSSGI